MLSANDSLEIKGSLQINTFAELLREFTEAKLSGSFRLSNDSFKAIVYLNRGEVVFAVSNQRQHKLFEILLNSYKIVKEIFAEIPEFTNDMALSEALIKKELLTKADIDAAFTYQINLILQTVFGWEKGEWIFSPFSKIKDSIRFEINYTNLLVNFARSMSGSDTIRRFKSFEESFGVNQLNKPTVQLYPQEAYILSRFGDSLTKIREIITAGGLSDAETLKNLYVLWLGNFIIRKNWNSVLTERKIREILSAKLSLIKEPEITPVKPVLKYEPKLVEESENILSIPEEESIKTPLDEKDQEKAYLNRIEKAESYYEMLEIPITSDISEIKVAYFKLAKNFHPDKYHQQSREIQQRIQNAFTEIARAYETLKDSGKRETYDYKLRKYLETVTTVKTTTVNDSEQGSDLLNIDTPDRASDEFQQGFDLLMNEDYAEAASYLFRAVQLAPSIAKYHAYYGKAISIDEKQKHKAESEIQTAIKLDPENATFRIMLVELFIQFGLLRRAEGELQRCLTAFPNNREAQVLLESLPKKS